jgi:hypothetical protein
MRTTHQQCTTEIGERARQHPQPGNRFVSFDAARGGYSLGCSALGNVAPAPTPPLAPASLSRRALRAVDLHGAVLRSETLLLLLLLLLLRRSCAGRCARWIFIGLFCARKPSSCSCSCSCSCSSVALMPGVGPALARRWPHWAVLRLGTLL